MSNHTTLALLRAMNAPQVAGLPVDHLALLHDEVDALKADAKRLADLLNDALHQRFGEAASAARRAGGKDIGRARLEAEGFEVVADAPKRVEWDQPLLAAAIATLSLWRERRMVDPNDQEVAAMRAAGDIAGRYIDAVGRTDMATWSEQDWHGFIEAICGAYVDALIEQKIAVNSALAKVQGAPG